VRRTVLIAVAMVAAVIAAGCNAGAQSELTAKTWQLTAFTEKVPAFQGVIPAEDQPNYTITFGTDGKFAATADCNQVAGTYTTSGKSITITPGPSTLAFCGEGSFGDLYVHALSQAAQYEIANNQLTITLSNDGTLTFSAAAATGSSAASAPASVAAATAKPTASPTAKATAKPTTKPTTAPGATPAPSNPAGLVGKEWQLTAITEKVPAFQGVVPADQQANYTITFAADGTFSAKADCNTLSGTFTTPDPNAASGALTIVPGAGTVAACPEGSLADLYVLGLGNVISYAINDGQLSMTLADQGSLTFK
jgi:heat shock protein HslJ